VSRRVGVGLAGLGRMGRLHAHNLARARRAELVRVVDTDERLAQTTARELGVECSASFDELLGDPRVEAVVVSTPTQLHAPMVELAAAAGKHVLCEKPIALELDAARHAVDSANEAGVKLQVGFHRRFDPDWVAAAERISTGELGDVYLFRTSLRDMSPPSIEYVRSSGGLFVDVTIHDLDTARWLVGDIDEVTAIGAALSDPAFAEAGDVDNAIVMLRFASGALGVIDNSRVAGYGYDCSTEIVGSKATVRIAQHRRVHNEWLTPGSASVDWVVDFTERYAEAYARELEDFAAAILDDRPVAVSGEDAIAAFVLARACDRSWRERRPVQLRHEDVGRGVRYALEDAA
jgi:myo-inositol 2-dehydrogenase/D-chiro-inositol 1-dehydrogenase